MEHIKTLEAENEQQCSELKLVKGMLKMLKTGENNPTPSVQQNPEVLENLHSAHLKIGSLERDLQKANEVVEKQNQAISILSSFGLQVRDHLSFCDAQKIDLIERLQRRDIQVAALFHIAEHNVIFPGIAEEEWNHFMELVRSEYPVLEPKLAEVFKYHGQEDNLESQAMHTQTTSHQSPSVLDNDNFRPAGTYLQPEYDSDSSNGSPHSNTSPSSLGKDDETSGDEQADPHTPQSDTSGPPYRPTSPQHIDLTVCNDLDNIMKSDNCQCNSKTLGFEFDAEDDLLPYSY